MNTSQFLYFRKKAVLILASCGMLLSSDALFGAIIFDTLTGISQVSSQPVGFNGSFGPGEPVYERYAERFTPGAGYTEITEVKIRLRNYNDLSDGTYFVTLYGDNGGEPNDAVQTPLTSGDIGNLTHAPTDVLIPLSITVTPETPYWIVLSTTTTGENVVDWSYMDENVNPNPLGAEYSLGYNGTIWTDQETRFNPQMQISAVPEPQDYALAAALGLLGFGLWHHRRFVKYSALKA